MALLSQQKANKAHLKKADEEFKMNFDRI